MSSEVQQRAALERLARQFLAAFRGHAFRSVHFEVERTETDGDHGVEEGIKQRVRVELFDGSTSTIEDEVETLRGHSRQGIVGALADTLDDWHDTLDTALARNTLAVGIDRVMLVDGLGTSFRDL